MKVFYILVFLALLGASSSASIPIKGDLLKFVSDAVKRIIGGATGQLRPDYVFKSIENTVRGLPYTLAFRLVNRICTALITQERLKTPENFSPKLADMKFQFRTPCAVRSYPVADPTGLAADADFDAKKKTVIVATGWKSTVNNSRHDELAQAYHCRGDTNYIALDFGEYINTLYYWSAKNTDVIGKHVAEGIKGLSSIINIADLHLIGHSLGAQIMSSVARYYRTSTGKSLPYITGLDPASPCFKEGEQLTTLSASDADFVDIIHTNPSILGQSDVTGHVDFFVGGKFPIQTGCRSFQCSHRIAIPLYTESVYPNNADNFQATRCDSLRNYQSGKCPGKTFPMGYAVPHNLRGEYVLEINKDSPYGKNARKDFSNPKTTTCGICSL